MTYPAGSVYTNANPHLWQECLASTRRSQHAQVIGKHTSSSSSFVGSVSFELKILWPAAQA